MARKRQIDPVYPLEQEIAQLSIHARYFYIISWCHMDDETGVLPYDIFMLKGQIFPADDIDVEKIIEEIVAMHRYFPFEAEGKRWLWCPTMPKHQTINHPSKRKYPIPPKTLQEDYRSGKLALPQSRVELSRVELNKTQPYWAAFTKKTQDIMLFVSKTRSGFKQNAILPGFNIYQLLGKIKKTKKIEIPEEVVQRVCVNYDKNRFKIKADWPWFMVTLQKEWEAWNAEKNIAEGAEYKAKAPLPQSIKDLVEMILKLK
jgi:hypothetical protein